MTETNYILTKKELDSHWNYFLSLDKDLFAITNFIEPVKANLTTYSIALNKIILLASSEFEVLAKQLCSFIDSDNDYSEKSMNVLRKAIIRKYPRIHETIIKIPAMGTEINPIKSWKDDKSPNWWKDYNAVKHRRYQNYELSNFENAIYALSGVMALNMYLYISISSKDYVFFDRLPTFFDCSYLPEIALGRAPSHLPDLELLETQ